MIKIDDYTYLDLQVYRDKIQLVQGRLKEDQFKADFMTIEIGGKDNKREQLMPRNVVIGDKAKRIEVGLWLLKEATGKDYEPIEYADDIPF